MITIYAHHLKQSGIFYVEKNISVSQKYVSLGLAVYKFSPILEPSVPTRMKTRLLHSTAG